MGNKSLIACPQCMHQNTIDAACCTLCGWVLKQEQLDATCISQIDVDKIDPNHTTLPNPDNSENIDPDLTQAPNRIIVNASESNHSIAEKQTFHLAGDLAHFEILEILGQGGMGAVYHAKDRTLHRDVALKMLRPLTSSNNNSTDALLDEARMASKLNHPNIVTIYDVARSKDSNYIVMEWVDGKPLDELIPNNGLELEKALEYACQIADGLSNAHQKYIIHRDIKPQNIMLSDQNSIKILDFGIAGYFDHNSDDKEDLSDTNKISIGTPSYMSPEQAQGLNLDQRTDIFSFGIVFYQMLSGKRPFFGNNLTEIKQAICTGDYIPIQKQVPELPMNIVNLIDKMLATQKDQRWQSSAELAEELHNIYNELTYKKNWWQRRNWISKAAIILPFVLAIGWSSKEILFPASTQQLIERQLQEANKIAILPFDNISGDPLLQLFSDGLAVNLGSDLAAIASHQGNTWIVPSTEISRMKDQSPKEVADKYGVNLILTGSIQHMGSTRLLVLNLLNGNDGQQLKTVEVNIDAKNLFQGHSKVRQNALELLGWNIPHQLNMRFQENRPQIDGAYREYIQGKGYLYRYDQVGNLNHALEAFNKAIKIDESYESPYLGLAEVYLSKFKKTKDVSWLEKMTVTINDLKNIAPKNKQISYLFAEIAMQKGDYEKAIVSFQTSINQNNKNINSHIGLANAYSKSGNLNMAESIYETSSQLSPNNWKLIAYIGIFHFRNGNYLKALKQFEKLTIMSPNNHYGFRNMAAIFYTIDDIDSAIIYTEKAIKLKATDKAYSNLGTMLFYKKKYQESIIAYKKAIEINNTVYMHWGNLADAYKLSKNSKSVTSYQEAVRTAKIVLKTNVNDSTAKAALSYYLANLNKEEEAIFFAKQITKGHTGLENFIVATAYEQLEKVDSTLIHLEYALNKNYPIKEINSTPFLKKTRKDMRYINMIKN